MRTNILAAAPVNTEAGLRHGTLFNGIILELPSFIVHAVRKTLTEPANIERFRELAGSALTQLCLDANGKGACCLNCTDLLAKHPVFEAVLTATRHYAAARVHLNMLDDAAAKQLAMPQRDHVLAPINRKPALHERPSGAPSQAGELTHGGPMAISERFRLFRLMGSSATTETSLQTSVHRLVKRWDPDKVIEQEVYGLSLRWEEVDRATPSETVHEWLKKGGTYEDFPFSRGHGPSCSARRKAAIAEAEEAQRASARAGKVGRLPANRTAPRSSRTKGGSKEAPRAEEASWQPSLQRSSWSAQDFSNISWKGQDGEGGSTASTDWSNRRATGWDYEWRDWRSTDDGHSKYRRTS